MYKNLKYLIFFFNAFLFSQEGSVSGVVLSEESVPMPGANVAIKELGIGSITNAEGYFSIKSLEAATYTLDITYIGYKKISKSFVITPTNSDESTGSFLEKLDIDESTADSDTEYGNSISGLKFMMEPDPVALRKVDVTAHEIDKSISDILKQAIFGPSKIRESYMTVGASVDAVSI